VTIIYTQLTETDIALSLGIPFRRGYLLVSRRSSRLAYCVLTRGFQYGAPGSGKTSIIHSLAGELGLDIYIVSLSKIGLDDTMLNSLITQLPQRCIALMEDIDAAFKSGLTRDMTTEEKGEKSQNPGEDAPDGRKKDPTAEVEKGPTATRITLSGLLNALDGVAAQEGRLLFATTNRYSALDPALIRPGRMDLHVEFRLASRFQTRELFRRFFVPSIAQHNPHNTTDETRGADSGYTTPSNDSAAEDSTSKSPSSTSSSSSVPVVEEAPAFNGTKHSARAPTLSAEQVERLATQFADSIPERQFSMASLQGYLMLYKTRPLQAVEDISRWVEDKLAEQERGLKGGSQRIGDDKSDSQPGAGGSTREAGGEQVSEADSPVVVEKKDAVIQMPSPGDGEAVES
jgi:mitochondrial chaperone BCS1